MSWRITRPAVALGAVLVLAACGAAPPAAGTPPGSTPLPSASATPSSTSTPTATPTPAATPQPTPTPAAAPPAGFECRNFSGGSTSAGSAVAGVRIGSHDGYDRFVIEFAGAIPGYSITRQGTGFVSSPKGEHLTLEGDSGVLIRLQPIADWTSYVSPTYFHPQFTYLREVRMVENSEAVQQWGLGVNGSACLRVYELSSPSRLVVDVSG